MSVIYSLLTAIDAALKLALGFRAERITPDVPQNPERELDGCDHPDRVHVVENDIDISTLTHSGACLDGSSSICLPTSEDLALGFRAEQITPDVTQNPERDLDGCDHPDRVPVVEDDIDISTLTHSGACLDGSNSICLPTSEESQSLAKFHSLVDRSISAWRSINYVGPETDNEEKKNAVIDAEIQRLRRCTCLDDVLESKGYYWFFQLRDSFMQQKSTFMKWDPTQLDEYILLPSNYGFVNNEQCFFVSHYWHTKEHPDPKGVDLVQVQQDLRDLEWSYIWVDWTCVPQLPRTEIERRYFDRSLHFIHMLVRDCAFEWRFPAFEPRGWILYEVAEFVLNHKYFGWADDIRPFIEHLSEMSANGVRPVMRKYGYRCSRQGDLNLVIGWLELAILLAKILPEDDDVGARQEIWDELDRPYVGTLVVSSIGMEIDKVNGIIKYQGRTYNFTSTWRAND